MTVSYNWLSDYLPVTIDKERLSRILTSIGLEVEQMYFYEAVKGSLEGLVIGEVLTTEKHPNADKLTLTTVNTGGSEPLQIVCGAPNVAAGQKVVVAPVGTTIYPSNGDSLTMKIAKIRGVESYGMICAEDEIGLGTSHEGILVLDATAVPGTLAKNYFNPYTDTIYEIGLTPNRMDAMSHWGIARDVCAYIAHHDKLDIKPKLPGVNAFKPANNNLPIIVNVLNTDAAPRYSGVSISGITIGPSPVWMQQRLLAIGVRPINNIVDITNYIQHETGQPLHAFDADAINGKEVIVCNLDAGTPFITLDEKERKLNAADLMICCKGDGGQPPRPMCIAGVFGGIHSGVSNNTRNIFLESACFDPITIRKTSFAHGLRTDAASRFEKGTDISATVNVLKRAALLIVEICGGTISSNITDIYSGKKEKTEIILRYHYLKKLSGKNYHADSVKQILSSLGFEIIKDDIDAIRLAVPYHKTDISLPADIVEEILRIDGLDNIEIPESITISPAVEVDFAATAIKEKTAGYLAGAGFNEIITNAITNAAYYTDAELSKMVKMLNSLSAELNILRPSLLETSLECVARNLNRKNNHLRLFEFGKAYFTEGESKFTEINQLGLVVSGNKTVAQWNQKPEPADFYYLKGILSNILRLLGVTIQTENAEDNKLNNVIALQANNKLIGKCGVVNDLQLEKFGIKQPVYFAELNWDIVIDIAIQQKQKIEELPKFPSIQRDLAFVVDSKLQYHLIEAAINKAHLSKLTAYKLFDVFENEKVGTGKKSMAVNFTFIDPQKTLTDKEIDGWMAKIIDSLEKEVNAEVRK